jgi:hypothetical protein
MSLKCVPFNFINNRLKRRESDFCIKELQTFIDVVNNFDHSYVTCGQEACMKPIRNSLHEMSFLGM